jgi:hypothetical protein
MIWRGLQGKGYTFITSVLDISASVVQPVVTEYVAEKKPVLVWTHQWYSGNPIFLLTVTWQLINVQGKTVHVAAMKTYRRSRGTAYSCPWLFESIKTLTIWKSHAAENMQKKIQCLIFMIWEQKILNPLVLWNWWLDFNMGNSASTEQDRKCLWSITRLVCSFCYCSYTLNSPIISRRTLKILF